MFTIRKVIKFEAAHQLSSAYSKVCTDCIHGHSYIVELFLRSADLNKDGMVADFGLVKKHASFITEQWDHALIIDAAATEKIRALSLAGNYKIVPFPGNPTAELMAFTIFNRMVHDVPELHKVRVHETTTGWAEYKEELWKR